jgi:ATP-dependent RNA helicase HelY
MSRHDKNPRYRRVKTPRPVSEARESGKRDERADRPRRDNGPRAPRLESRVSGSERERQRRRAEEELGAPEPATESTWTLRRDPESLALVEGFAAEQPYPLDDFQIEAAQHLAEGRSVLVAAPTGTGKALASDTLVLTPIGWSPIAQLHVGDSVIGSDGQAVTVTGIFPQGIRPAYRVTFTDGASVICDLDHLWAVNTKSRRHDRLPWRILTLRQIMAEGLSDGIGWRHFIPVVSPVAFITPEDSEEISSELSLQEARKRTLLTQRALAAQLGVSQRYIASRELNQAAPSLEYIAKVHTALAAAGNRQRLDPYLVGLLLGDGSFLHGRIIITSADDEVIESVRAALPADTLLLKSKSRPYDWHIVGRKIRTQNSVVRHLRELGLTGHQGETKFVPHRYKFASISDRLAILRGLLDSDGSVDKNGGVEYSSVSLTLAEDVAFLVRSLSGRCRIRPKHTQRRVAYRLWISMGSGIVPFSLQRKVERYIAQPRRQPTRAIASVEPVGETDMMCISVNAPDGLFVVDGFVVTHNTIVAEMAIWLARRDGMRAIYTTPVKALSNQKFRDLRARYGAEEVGLLTGDIVENPGARIVVMTTEIYRNMLLEGLRAAHVTPREEAAGLLAGVDARYGAPKGVVEAGAADVAEMARQARLDEELSSVGCVIFDELHYLNDPQRGPVWEEAIIHSPRHVVFAGLSATVSNASELRRWIEEVHGPMAMVYHTERSVPLESYYFLDGKLHLVRDASGRRVARFPGVGGEAKAARMRDRARRYTFDGSPRPRIESVSDTPTLASMLRGQVEAEEEPPERQAPQPGEVLTALRAAKLLPCLYFLPGRRAVEEAAERAAVHLFTTPEQRARLTNETRAWIRALPPEDQKLEQARKLLYLLPRGLGFHHAGLLPGLKVMVETLFQRGELKAVFATDTLALGINMPARAVVLGSVSKFDGQQMRLMTPNEYQQVTGRAGRRGMDENGAAVLLYSPWDSFEPAFAALTAPLLPVTSAFIVRYNTVLNLWMPGDQARLRRAVAASLREFQRRGIHIHRAIRRRGARADEATEVAQAAYEPASAGDTLGARRLSRAALAELNATIYVLRALDYIGQDDALTARGRLLRAIFHPAGIAICELLFSGALDNLSPAELAEVMSWFTFDNDRSLKNAFIMQSQVSQARRATRRALAFIQEFEDNEGLAMSPSLVDSFHSVALNWARGASLATLLRKIDLAEGDLLVTLNQTIDLLQQVQGAMTQALGARDVWRASGPDARQSQPALDQARVRLEAILPRLAESWRVMLRGSVALSRAIPAMATPDAEEAAEAAALPPLAMAEDEDPEEAAADRAEEGPAGPEPDA